MESFITFAQNATPIMVSLVIIGGLVHVVMLLLKHAGILKNVGKNQITQAVGEMAEFGQINEKLDVIAGNHLHGLPDMQKSLDRIENKQDKMVDLLTQINTKIK